MPRIKYRKGSKKYMSKPLVANPSSSYPLRVFCGGTIYGIPLTTSTATSWSDGSSTLPSEPELRTDIFIQKGATRYAIRSEATSTNWNDHTNTHSDSSPHSDTHSDVAHSDTPHSDNHFDWTNNWNDSVLPYYWFNAPGGSHQNWSNYQPWWGEKGSGSSPARHWDCTPGSTIDWINYGSSWTNGGQSGKMFYGAIWSHSSGSCWDNFIDISHEDSHADDYVDSHSDTPHSDTHSNWSDHYNWPNYWSNHANSWQRVEESI